MRLSFLSRYSTDSYSSVHMFSSLNRFVWLLLCEQNKRNTYVYSHRYRYRCKRRNKHAAWQITWLIASARLRPKDWVRWVECTIERKHTCSLCLSVRSVRSVRLEIRKKIKENYKAAKFMSEQRQTTSRSHDAGIQSRIIWRMSGRQWTGLDCNGLLCTLPDWVVIRRDDSIFFFCRLPVEA